MDQLELVVESLLAMPASYVPLQPICSSPDAGARARYRGGGGLFSFRRDALRQLMLIGCTTQLSTVGNAAEINTWATTGVQLKQAT